MARHKYDMMWLSQHGMVRTASDKSQMYVNKLCMLVGPCPAVPTWPEGYSHISAKLCMNCLKLSGHTGRHDRSRQDVVHLYEMCAQKCLDLSGHTGRRGRSEQLVATRRATGSSRFLFQPCCVIIIKDPVQ